MASNGQSTVATENTQKDDKLRNVWYCLVTSDGKAFQASSTTSTELTPSTTIIAKFRKVIMTENAFMLRHHVSSMLKVYGNKTLLDKKIKAAADKSSEHEQPLNVTLVGLGTIEDDALMVVVPDVPMRRLPGSGTFIPCTTRLFSELVETNEDNNWLHFLSNVPHTTLPSLYIRPSYKVIADAVLSKRKKNILISGTSGIGKSVFLNYIMWRLVKAKQRILLFATPMVYFDGYKMWYCDYMPRPSCTDFWTRELWCLVDASDPATIDGFPHNECAIFLTSSTRRDFVNSLCDLFPTPVSFYMPCWTEQELETVAPLFPDAKQEWRRRFKYLGGTPRYVLQNRQHDPMMLVQEACRYYPLDKCIREVTFNQPFMHLDDLLERLIHLKSEPPYRKVESCYASKTALAMVAEAHWDDAKAQMSDLLDTCEGLPLTTALCRFMFEEYAMGLLEKGGTFKCRELGTDNKVQRVTIKGSHKVLAEDVATDQKANQLYLPITSDFPELDAWIPNVGGFQLIVGKTHSIHESAPTVLAKLHRKGENRLYLVVPPSHYDEFTKQEPMSVRQFVLLIPHPKTPTGRNKTCC